MSQKTWGSQSKTKTTDWRMFEWETTVWHFLSFYRRESPRCVRHLVFSDWSSTAGLFTFFHGLQLCGCICVSVSLADSFSLLSPYWHRHTSTHCTSLKHRVVCVGPGTDNRGIHTSQRVLCTDPLREGISSFDGPIHQHISSDFRNYFFSILHPWIYLCIRVE